MKYILALFLARRKPWTLNPRMKSAERTFLYRGLIVLGGSLFFAFTLHLCFTFSAFAVVDPLSVPNNKFGIHIIQATPHESSPAAELVNSSGGEWGYVTFLIESKDRNENKWQEFFNDLRRRRLIPIVRLATQPEGDFWKRPYEGEEQAWSDFLDNLNWPTKNRYVIIYNEPNHAQEWGNKVDAKNYAEVLDKTITALKNKNNDFFVLNAGFDASAPQRIPNYQDQLSFMREMNEEVPGIFSKLDGWVSHSYPNPDFIGSPYASGRGTVRTYLWELQILKQFGVTKDLSVFITETGWKHSEGLKRNNSLPDPERVAEYYQTAFNSAWNDNRIVAVTPFLLTYEHPPFDHFSFKRVNGVDKEARVLGARYPEYHPHYEAVHNMAKIAGAPVQEDKAELVEGEVYRSIVAGEDYDISITLKNTGQSIWNDENRVRLVATQGKNELGIEDSYLPEDVKIEPNQEHTFHVRFKAPSQGNFEVSLNLFNGNKEFESSPLKFTTEVKSPVILRIKSLLKWKNNHSGEYFLTVAGAIGETTQQIPILSNGYSQNLEARHLLPEYTFDFTLTRPFYKSKTIRQSVTSGMNELDFGELQPDILQALSSPADFWKLLPFSN